MDLSDRSLTLAKMDLDSAIWQDLGDWQKQLTNLATAYQPVVAQLPSSLQDFIGPIRPETIWEASKRYGLILDARKIFRKIAHLDLNFHSAPIPDLQISAALRVDERGWVKIESNVLIEALTEKVGRKKEGIAAARIRQCPICEKIFWAGRLSKVASREPYCSLRCGQTYRQREWRKKYQENYKQQRIRKADEKEDKATSAVIKRQGKTGKAIKSKTTERTKKRR